MISYAAIGVLLLSGLCFFLARAKVLRAAHGAPRRLHSQPNYHGWYSGGWVLLVGLLTLAGAALGSSAWIDARMTRAVAAASSAELAEAGALSEGRTAPAPIQIGLLIADARAIAEGQASSRADPLRRRLSETYAGLAQAREIGVSALTLALALLTAALTIARIGVKFRARNRSEWLVRGALFVSAALAILATAGILLSLIGETLRFFSRIGWRVDKFLFGTNWSPLANQRATPPFVSADDVGWLPLLSGTMMITLIAMLVAAPIGLMAAIYLSDYATPRFRALAKPLLEILAGIPTVVYGFFAAVTVAPFIRDAGESLGLEVSAQSALAAGVVMGVMIIPFVSSLSDDVINAVPQTLRDGSLALGATKSETIRRVVLPAALPGVISAMILGVSRAIGETMIVVMAAGQGPNLTADPLDTATTVTVQIVQLIVGDTQADLAAGPAFALGFALFLVTLTLNIVALRVVRRYREIYD